MKLTAKKIALIAILTAIALIIFIIEAQIPLPIPIPGVKLGLANVVTLFALFYNSPNKPVKPINPANHGKPINPANHGKPINPVKPNKTQTLTTGNAFTILLCRITLGAVFTGRLVAFAYSLTGGLFGFTAQVIIKKFISTKQIWVCGAIGAIFHNIGQILAAIIITGTPALVAYLPILMITGIITGVLTGLITQITLQRLSFGRQE